MHTRPISFSVLLILVAATALAAETPRHDRQLAVERMVGAVDVQADVNPVTGTVRQARFKAGAAVPEAVGRSEKAEHFMLRYGEAFGIDSHTSQLALERDHVDRIGHSRLVYDQVYRGVPVFGGRFAIHFDAAGELIGANGSVLPDVSVPTVRPAIGETEARELAAEIVAKRHEIDAGFLTVESSELVIFHDGAVWGRSGEARLAWNIELVSDGSIAEQLFIDAGDGRLLGRIDRIEPITRRIYENSQSNLVWEEGDPLPYSGSGPGRDEEINNLITVAEQTYNTFRNISGGTFLKVL